MNTLKLKIFYLLTLLSIGKNLGSQSLILSGHMQNNNKSIKCHYELHSSGGSVIMGYGSRLKLNLECQEVYTLTISEPGYQSKTILVSTFTNSIYRYNFSFKIQLDSVEGNDQPLVRAGDIFYNSDLSNYDYRSYLENETQKKTESTHTEKNETLSSKFNLR